MSYFHQKRLQDPNWWIVVAISIFVIIIANLFFI